MELALIGRSARETCPSHSNGGLFGHGLTLQLGRRQPLGAPIRRDVGRFGTSRTVQFREVLGWQEGLGVVLSRRVEEDGVRYALGVVLAVGLFWAGMTWFANWQKDVPTATGLGN